MKTIKAYPALYTLLLLLVALLLWKLWYVIGIIYIAFLFVFILRPFAKVLAKINIPSIIAAFIPLLILISLLIGLGLYIYPIVIEEFPRAAQHLESAIEHLPFDPEVMSNIQDTNHALFNIANDYFNHITSFGQQAATVLFGMLTIIVITIYCLRDYEKINANITKSIPKKYQNFYKTSLYQIEQLLGKWFLGQLIISIIIGVVCWLSALALGLPYPALLGLLAGIFEFVPTIGPILASLPAIGFGLLDSPEKALIVAVVYIIIQQIESYVLIPLLMGGAVRLHPVIMIVSFMVGSLLFGIVGALFSVPTALIIKAIYTSYKATVK